MKKQARAPVRRRREGSHPAARRIAEAPPEGESGGAQLLWALPQIFVVNLEEACRFFTDTLGFKVEFKWGEPAFYALVRRDGARINLRFVHRNVYAKGEETDLLAASIAVENVEALYLEYRAKGAPMHQSLKKQPWGARDFIVRDPEGNLIHFAG